MDTNAVTVERLEGWRRRLQEENATPIVGIGVGHGEKSGRLVLLVPEGVEAEVCVGSGHKGWGTTAAW